MNQLSSEIEPPGLPEPLTVFPYSTKNSETKRTLMGIGLVALSGITFGIQGIMGKFAFSEGANVLTLLMFRFGMAALVVWIILGLLWSSGKPLDLRQPVPRLLGIGFLGLLWITNALFYFLALELLPASTNSLLVYVYPALVVLWSVLFFKEKLTRLKATALVLALAGCCLTVDPLAALAITASFSFLGALLSLASAFSNSWYVILAARIGPEVSGIVKTAYSLSVTAVCFTLYVLVSSSFSAGMSPGGWLWCLAIGALTGVSVYLFMLGVNLIGASRTAIIASTEPATAILLGALLLAEPLTLVKLIGSLCIVGAIFLLSRTGKG
jgi:drug/metabolite transporter (DMT)-like permease